MCLLFFSFSDIALFFASGAFSSIIIVPELPFTIHVNQFADMAPCSVCVGVEIGIACVSLFIYVYLYAMYLIKF